MFLLLAGCLDRLLEKPRGRQGHTARSKTQKGHTGAGNLRVRSYEGRTRLLKKSANTKRRLRHHIGTKRQGQGSKQTRADKAQLSALTLRRRYEERSYTRPRRSEERLLEKPRKEGSQGEDRARRPRTR